MVTHPFSVSRIQKQQGDVLPDVSPNSPILFPLHFVSKYETAKNGSRKNVIFENMFDLQVYRSSYRLVHMAIWWRCFGFNRFTWDQPRPKLPLLPPKRLGTTVRATQPNDAAPENGWLEDYENSLLFGMAFWKVGTVSFRGCNFPGVVFFWKVGSDYHWIRCGSSQDSSISHSPVVSSWYGEATSVLYL